MKGVIVAIITVSIAAVIVVGGLLFLDSIHHPHPKKGWVRHFTGRLGIAVTTYRKDVGAYPPSLKALVEQPIGAEGWKGPYLISDLVPKDPWGNDYRYKSPGDEGRDFDIWSAGPDGKSGTADDITSW